MGGPGGSILDGRSTMHREAGRIRLEGDKLIAPHGEPLVIRPRRDGVWVGCTFVTWDAWDELKKRVAEYE